MAEGRVRLRWFGQGDSVYEGDRVDEMLAKASKKWFASNRSPERFVMAVVIERGDARMSDEEADAYMSDELALKRASREISGKESP